MILKIIGFSHDNQILTYDIIPHHSWLKPNFISGFMPHAEAWGYCITDLFL
jgi:hypothetical protein